MLCADQHPDYRSIARFRKRHLEALGELFVQALRLCAKAKLGPPPLWPTLLWLLYSVCISYESEQSLSSRRSGVCVSGG